MELKLYYYRDPSGNFGDDINPWLWPRVLPTGVLDDDPSARFVGIGTLLGRHIPVDAEKWIMGSGTGYSQFPPVDKRWHFCCVRGPLTARAFGLDADSVATDPAALVHRETELMAQIRDGVAFMPHHVSSGHFNWRALCERVGIRYVDPRAPVADTLLALARSRLVIAEAMHGAIVADALRVPWVPVTCYDHILPFKWLDWTASLGVEYVPRPVDSLWDVEAATPPQQRARNRVKRTLRAAGLGRQRWARVPNAASTRRTVESVGRQLLALARLDGTLSTDRALMKGLMRVDRAIEHFLTAAIRADAAMGTE